MLIKYWPDRTKIPFMSFRIAGALFSMILIAGSAFLLGTRGLNFGVDFAGGTVMELAKTDTVTVPAVREAMPINAEVNSARGTDGREIVVVKVRGSAAGAAGRRLQVAVGRTEGRTRLRRHERTDRRDFVRKVRSQCGEWRFPA
jgi:preprotein translocase subunit SecF